MEKEILKKIFKNLIIAVVVMAYFISLNIMYTQLEFEKMIMITKIFSSIFLLSGLIVLEIAYKKESGTLTITAIELLILSMHALFVNHVITIYHFDFRTYLLTSSYVFAIYYVLKSIIIYTKARRKYLKSLSDVSEIVKDEPIIKEAKKRNDVEAEKETEKTKLVEGKVESKKEIKPKSIKVKNRKRGTSKNTKKENKQTTQKQAKIENEKKTETSTKKTTKKKIEENEEKTKNEGKVERKEKAKNSHKTKEIKQVQNTNQIEETTKVQKPKSKRGRKKKEEVIKND